MGKKHPLSDDEKNELVLKYQRVVHYYAYRYRFVDPDRDVDEVRGWAYLGLAKAISLYEENPEAGIESFVFSQIKKAVFTQYYTKSRRPQSEVSLQRPLNFEADSGTIEDTISYEETFDISEHEIRKMIEEALFEESVKFRRINLDFYLSTKDPKDIAKEYGVTEAAFRRIHRRGQALIKHYLVTNDIILEYLTSPSEERKKEEGIINHREVHSNEYGKIKYLTKFYPFFTMNDIAVLLDTSSFMIMQILDYQTATYVKAKLDDSIKLKAMKYCQKKYPERIPGEVVSYQDVSQIRA